MLITQIKSRLAAAWFDAGRLRATIAGGWRQRRLQQRKRGALGGDRVRARTHGSRKQHPVRHTLRWPKRTTALCHGAEHSRKISTRPPMRICSS